MEYRFIAKSSPQEQLLEEIETVLEKSLRIAPLSEIVREKLFRIIEDGMIDYANGLKYENPWE